MAGLPVRADFLFASAWRPVTSEGSLAEAGAERLATLRSDCRSVDDLWQAIPREESSATLKALLQRRRLATSGWRIGISYKPFVWRDDDVHELIVARNRNGFRLLQELLPQAQSDWSGDVNGQTGQSIRHVLTQLWRPSTSLLCMRSISPDVPVVVAFAMAELSGGIEVRNAQVLPRRYD